MRIDSEGKQISIFPVYLNRHLLSHVQVPPNQDLPYRHYFEDSFQTYRNLQNILYLEPHLVNYKSIRK